ncbi:MAG TPA: ComEA family DNA-binding protein [Cellulomonas sp.]
MSSVGSSASARRARRLVAARPGLDGFAAGFAAVAEGDVGRSLGPASLTAADPVEGSGQKPVPSSDTRRLTTRPGGRAPGGWVPAAVRVAADEYGRAHPDPLDGADDAPAPGGVRRSRETRPVRWAVSWRVAGTAALAVALVAGAVVLRSAALTPGTAVELPDPVPLGSAAVERNGASDGAGDGVGDGAGNGAADGPGNGGVTTPAPSPPAVLVHVVGAVAVPGVVGLPAGSRVVDAIAAAGGAAGDADLSGLNLARVLVDGEQVAVPRPGDPPSAATPDPPGDGAAGRLVDLNTASLAQLVELPGVGPVLAQRIVDRRPFRSVDELDEVSGVGPTLLERLRPLVRV